MIKMKMGFPNLSKYIASDGHINVVEKSKINVEANFGNLKTDEFQVGVEEIDWQRDFGKFGKLIRTLSEELGPGFLFGAGMYEWK
jgi:hypothetical protein